MVRRVFLASKILVASVFLLSTISGANAQVVAVGKFIYDASVEMRKWQQAQPWGKYRSVHWKPFVRIGNTTPQNITVTVESDNCDATTEVLVPGEFWDIRCDDGNGGDEWYNYTISGVAPSSADPGDVIAVEMADNGQLFADDVTQQVKAQAAR